MSREIVVHGRRRVVLEPFDPPDPSGREVTVATRYTLVSSGTEASYVDGTNQKATYPLRLGYSNVGVVTKVGVDSHLTPGERVFCFGRHASEVTVHEDSVFPLGNVLDLAGLFCNMVGFAVGGTAVVPRIVGRHAGVTGLGVLGHITTQVLLYEGAATVTGSSSMEYRRGFAAKGVTAVTVLDPDSTDFTVEASGQPARILEALEATRPGGTVSLLGSPREPVELDLYRLVHRKGLAVIGAHMGSRLARTPSWSTAEVMSWTLARFSRGELDLTPLVTDVVAPDELAGMYDALTKRWHDHMAVVVDWS